MEFVEMMEGKVWVDRRRVIRSVVVRVVGVRKVVEVCLDKVMVNVVEEELRVREVGRRVEEMCGGEVSGVEVRDIDDVGEVVRREWEEWVEGDREVGKEVEGDVEDGVERVRMGVGKVGRVRVCDVWVRDRGEVRG